MWLLAERGFMWAPIRFFWPKKPAPTWLVKTNNIEAVPAYNAFGIVWKWKGVYMVVCSGTSFIRLSGNNLATTVINVQKFKILIHW